MMQSEPFFNNSVGGNFGQASAITQNSSPRKNKPKKDEINFFLVWCFIQIIVVGDILGGLILNTVSSKMLISTQI